MSVVGNVRRANVIVEIRLPHSKASARFSLQKLAIHRELQSTENSKDPTEGASIGVIQYHNDQTGPRDQDQALQHRHIGR